MHSLEFTLPDADATVHWGARLGKALLSGLTAEVLPSVGTALPPFLVGLSGDLGAGKTTLVRGLLRALSFTGPVKSPSFSLLETYTLAQIIVHHFDFYRFSRAEEFLDAGFDELFAPGCERPTLCLAEWADQASPWLPPPDWRLQLERTPVGRRAHLQACSERGRLCLNVYTQGHPER
jgi:tRNA threonylcarbamoyladenosine biosynthesis protein TsaE